MRLKNRILAVPAILLVLAPMAGAAAGPPAPLQRWVMQQLVANDPAATLERLAQGIVDMARRYDQDGGGFSARDVEIRRQKLRARIFSARMAEFLRNDLDTDGVLTRREIEIGTRPLGGSRHGRPATPPYGQGDRDSWSRAWIEAVNRLLGADADGDGRVTLVEMLAHARAKAEAQARKPDPRVLTEEVISGFDRDGDGAATYGEIADAVRRILGRFDADKDGLYSRDELLAAVDILDPAYAARALRRFDRLAGAWTDAGLPRISADGIFIVLGHAGGALSTVGFGEGDGDGAADWVTVADVVVEAGDEPIVLLLGAERPAIWRLSGAVSRISRVVAVGSKGEGASEVGVIGVPREKVAVAQCAPCVTPLAHGIASDERVGLVAATTGRKPDLMLPDAPGAGTLSIPGGKVDESTPVRGAIRLPETGPAALVWREAEARHPGGLVRIDPGDVVAAVPVAARDTLPGLYGLAQLVEEGALEIVETDVVRIVAGTTFIGVAKITVPPSMKVRHLEVARTFRITRKVTLPQGANTKRFILPAGVPEPDGVLRGLEIIRR